MTTTAMVDNILNVWEYATDSEVIEGKAWYRTANATAWELDHVDYRRGAGVLAALSPRLHWNKNVAYARLAFDLRGYALSDIIWPGVQAGTYIPALRNSVLKAMAIANGGDPRAILGGDKVTAFYKCIVAPYDTNAVVIDKHAIDIANGHNILWADTKGISTKVYNLYAEAYRTAAREIGEMPLELQAITWVAHRNIKKES